MKGDFSRSLFDAQKHYRGVRLQQGRVLLDADWNEQVDIQLHQTECDLRALLGIHSTPQANPGFAITLPKTSPTPAATGPVLPPDVQIAEGQRYVDGILCTSESNQRFSTQPDFPGAEQQRQAEADHPLQLVYLDVWSHHVTLREDANLGEVALDGLDTTTRLKTVAQVKFWPWTPASAENADPQAAERPRLASAFNAFLATQPEPSGARPSGKLTAQKTDEGTILQNQLYRVEIHRVENDRLGFKWSRENGSVTYAIAEINPNQEDPTQVDIYLKDVKPEQLDLQNKDWVEITSNHLILDGQAGVFGAVVDIQPDNKRITVKPVAPIAPADAVECTKTCMLLQRWDQKGSKDAPLEHGLVVVKFDQDMGLENGIQVKFSPGVYTVGDYWLIPARVNLNHGTGGIIWPLDEKQKQAAQQPPTGILHHYAALALLQHTADGWQILEHDESTFRTLPVLSDDVDKLDKRMTTAEGEIKQLHRAVDQLATALQKLDDRVTALEKRVHKVEKRLDDLQHIQLYQNFRADEELSVGTVVAYSSTKHEHVEKANANNATLLVGVVIEDEHKPIYRVAIQGRTHCKAVGALKPGALLIPSSKEAGAVEQAGFYVQPGTVLGKVLHVPETYKHKKTDKVEVLITLS
ncbi:MAG: DUF6519 domain-containing protein [Caldilineaceae bacterium]